MHLAVMAIMIVQEKASDQEETMTEKSQTSVEEAENLATDLQEKEEMNAMRIVASEVSMNVVQKKDSTKIATTINTAIAVMLEVPLVTSVTSTTKVVVTTDQNVKEMNTAVVVSKEERKTHSTTDQKQQDKYVLTNISLMREYAAAVRLMTSYRQDL